MTKSMVSSVSPAPVANAPRAATPWLGLGTPLQIGAMCAALVGAAALTLTLNGYFVFVIAGVAMLAICGVGLNLLLGLTGQVSFGHVGFYAIGAYAVAVLTGQAGWSFWAAWPVGALVAAVLGALLAETARALPSTMGPKDAASLLGKGPEPHIKRLTERMVDAVNLGLKLHATRIERSQMFIKQALVKPLL